MIALSLLLIVLITLSSVVTGKKDRNQPHPHNGKLKPYSPGSFPNLKLSKDDIKTLDSGNSVMKQTLPTDPNESGSAICIQDVHAPLQAVWYQILDMDNYTKKVSKLNENKNYVVKKNSDGTSTIKTKQVLGVLPGYSYESYYDHIYHPKQNSLTWTLDYEKTSDFDDVSGHWHVEELEPKKCRVFYACDIKMKGKVPGPILNYISKAALKQATAWVKRESEANPMKTVTKEYTPPHSTVSPAAAMAASTPSGGGGEPMIDKTLSSSRHGFWNFPALLPKRKLQ